MQFTGEGSMTTTAAGTKELSRSAHGTNIKPGAGLYPDENAKPVMGRYGSQFPKTVANGFTIIAPIIPGKANDIRAAGARVATAVLADPYMLAPLALHFLRWIIFDDDTRFAYIAWFDTDFDKYVEDAVMLFNKSGVDTLFENLVGFPEDWRTNPNAFAKYVRDHQVESFMEYVEYPNVTAIEVIKALAMKHAFGEVLDQMQ
jgi:hypothetical protein